MLLQRPIPGFTRPDPRWRPCTAKQSVVRKSVRFDDAFTSLGFEGFDDAFTSLGFEDIEGRMAAAQGQMDREFADLNRQFAEMDRGFAEMDREFAGLRHGITIFEPAAPSLSFEVQRSDNGSSVWDRLYQSDGYRPSDHFYMTVEVRSSGNHCVVPPPDHATAAAALPGPPVTLVAALLFGAYAAAAAAFLAKFDLTLYRKQRQWQMTLLWPVLCLGSSAFRRQFMSVLRGTRPRVATALQGLEADGSSNQQAQADR